MAPSSDRKFSVNALLPSVQRVRPPTSSSQFTSCPACPVSAPRPGRPTASASHTAQSLREAACAHPLSSPPDPPKAISSAQQTRFTYLPSKLSRLSLLLKTFSLLPLKNSRLEMSSLNPASLPIRSRVRAQGLCLCVSGQTSARPHRRVCGLLQLGGPLKPI